MFISANNIHYFLEIAIIRFCQQHPLNAFLFSTTFSVSSVCFFLVFVFIQMDLHKFRAFCLRHGTDEWQAQIEIVCNT